MTATVVVCTFADGSIGRTQFTEKTALRFPAAIGTPFLLSPVWTDEEIQAEYDKGNQGDWRNNPVVSWRRGTLEEFPDNGDHYFGKAWRQTGGEITIDMDSAREIQRDVLRHQRAAVFPALDVEYNNAVRKGETAKANEIEAERQRLRDITALPAIDAAKTPADLKAISVLAGQSSLAKTIAR